MIGGKLIAKGSSSCVFSPSIPCNVGSIPDNNKITKILFNKDSKMSYNKEKKYNNLIKKIKGYKDWAVIFNDDCKAPIHNILYKYDKEGIDECITNTIEIDAFNNRSYMFTGEYGGKTLIDYFKNNFSQIKNGKNLENKFIKLMKLMRPLFVGLCELQRNKVCHNDIKYNNIVYKNEKKGFRFIDFGLSSTFKDIDNFKKRSVKEFNTSRLYMFYPLEYIYLYTPHISLHNEKHNKRKNIDLISDIYRIFKLDFDRIKEETIELIKNNKINENKMIKRIDVYSLGILIPLLFLLFSNIINPHENNTVIYDFYLLFKKMCNPFSDNRITPYNALKELDRLLKKNKPTKRKYNRTKRKYNRK